MSIYTTIVVALGIAIQIGGGMAFGHGLQRLAEDVMPDLDMPSDVGAWCGLVGSIACLAVRYLL